MKDILSMIVFMEGEGLLMLIIMFLRDKLIGGCCLVMDVFMLLISLIQNLL
jgi:hypothetical protein